MAGYIGSKASVVSSGAERKKTFTITGATTSLTGLNYTVGKVHVFQNGVRLVDGTDYTATNGTTITLTVAAQNGDNVVVISQAAFQVALSGIDDQSNAVAMTIDSNENIGIGTSSPLSKLDVNGEAKITTGLTITPAASGVYATDSSLSSYATNNGVYLNGHSSGWLRLSGDGANRASIDIYGASYSNYNDEIHFKTGNVGSRLVISNDGKVGIGQTNPSQLLEVHKSAGGDQTAAKFSAHNYGDTGKTYIELGTEYGDGSSRIGSFNTSGNKSALVFEVHANTSGSFSEKMRIDDLGRVTTPSQPYFSAVWNLSGTGFVTSYTALLNNGNGFTITNGKIYVPVAGHYYINAYGIATDQFDTRVVANTTGNSPFLFDFRQSTWASGTHHGCGNGRVVYLASGSYVGIHRLSGTTYTGAGTSNPHNLISIMLMG